MPRIVATHFTLDPDTGYLVVLGTGVWRVIAPGDPIAAFGVVVNGLIVDATSSSWVAAGITAEYRWDWGCDDVMDTITGAHLRTSIGEVQNPMLYPAPGTYTISLTVSCSIGSSTAFVDVTVGGGTLLTGFGYDAFGISKFGGVAA